MVKTIFDNWLMENRCKFKYTPYIYDQKEDLQIIKFKRISPLVSFHLSENGEASIWIEHYDRDKYPGLIDWFTDFDILEKCDIQG